MQAQRLTKSSIPELDLSPEVALNSDTVSSANLFAYNKSM
ncbi:MAG: hypothetical protein ACI9E4_000856 [Pseudohongiellaceae bacterium]|jgi:hypothetical protein